MSSGIQRAVPVNRLVVGTWCPSDHFDSSGHLVVPAGTRITRFLVSRLKRRGVENLYVNDLPLKKRTSPNQVVSLVEPPTAEVPVAQRSPTGETLSTTYPPQRIKKIQSQFAAGQEAVTGLIESLKSGQAVDLKQTHPAVDAYIQELAEDPDPVLANALLYQADVELAERCVMLSVLSLAICQQIDVSEGYWRDIGAAALVHDWGLFDLPPECRFANFNMNPTMLESYRRHPLTAVEMLDRVENVEEIVKRYVAEVHERLDGSGFPRGLSATDILLGSRILAVADAYLSMTAPPIDQPRIVPCDAVAFLISAAARGTYSANAVTGLLKSISMYPIGSVVELSDMSQARVIRGNGMDYGYPIVETLTEPTRVIDLKETDVFVTRPIVFAERNEVRIPETYADLGQLLETV